MAINKYNIHSINITYKSITCFRFYKSPNQKASFVAQSMKLLQILHESNQPTCISSTNDVNISFQQKTKMRESSYFHCTSSTGHAHYENDVIL